MRLWVAVCVWCVLSDAAGATQIVFEGRLSSLGKPEVYRDRIATLTMTIDDYWQQMDYCGTNTECSFYRMHVSDLTGSTERGDGGWLEWEFRPYREDPFYPSHVPGTFGLWVRYDDWANGLKIAGDYGYFQVWGYSNNESGERKLAGFPEVWSFGLSMPGWYAGHDFLDVPTITDLEISVGRLYVLGGFRIDSMRIIHDELLPGDANADAVFDQLDIMQVLSAGKYLTGQRAAWSQGDWTADGLFDQQDIVVAVGNYGQQPAAVVRAVPEPSMIQSTILLLMCCFALLAGRIWKAKTVMAKSEWIAFYCVIFLIFVVCLFKLAREAYLST